MVTLIKSLGASLTSFRAKNLHFELGMFKFNVGTAYWQIPMYFLYQLLTVITVNGKHCINQCNNFQNCRSQRIWQSFMSLIMWILVFKRGLKHLKCYTDDVFLFSTTSNLTLYAPYHHWMPTEQANVLLLWDKIGLPHKNSKKISGPIIPCNGFDVNPNKMMVTRFLPKVSSLLRPVNYLAPPAGIPSRISNDTLATSIGP